jgi:hypothetical protein
MSTTTNLMQGTGEEVMFMDTTLCSLHENLATREIEFLFCGNIDAPVRVPRGSTQALYQAASSLVVFDIGVRRGRAFN